MSTLTDRFGITKTDSSWADIADKPTTFPPSEHNHDGVYLTVAGKAADSSLLDGVSWGNVNATIKSSTHIIAGDGGGAVALSLNDGYGNANVTFNHHAGTPDVTGNAGRIEVNVDATTNPTMSFELGEGLTAGVATAITTVMTLDKSGNLVATGNVTAYSDARLKENIEVISNALWKVQQISGYTFDRIDTKVRQTGVLAQEVAEVLPEVVMDAGEGRLAVSYGNMAGLLIEAIKELSYKVDALENRA